MRGIKINKPLRVKKKFASKQKKGMCAIIDDHRILTCLVNKNCNYETQTGACELANYLLCIVSRCLVFIYNYNSFSIQPIADDTLPGGIIER